MLYKSTIYIFIYPLFFLSWVFHRHAWANSCYAHQYSGIHFWPFGFPTVSHMENTNKTLSGGFRKFRENSHLFTPYFHEFSKHPNLCSKFSWHCNCPGFQSRDFFFNLNFLMQSFNETKQPVNKPKFLLPQKFCFPLFLSS